MTETSEKTIERAAQIVHDVSCKVFGVPSSVPGPGDIEIAQCLADAGLLVEVPRG